MATRCRLTDRHFDPDADEPIHSELIAERMPNATNGVDVRAVDRSRTGEQADIGGVVFTLV